jgi:cytochrome c peroxidase
MAQSKWNQKVSLLRFHIVRGRSLALIAIAIGAIALGFASAHASIGQSLPNIISNLHPFPDPSGEVKTFTAAGFIDETNPFFQDLGTNGRRCVTCHQASDAWSVTPPHIQQRFNSTAGTDPIFRLVDGATCPNADVSSVRARREAYQLLLTKGLIRIGLSVPASADFVVTGVDTPYTIAGQPNVCGDTTSLSMYRRPLPSTNLGFLSTVMWDGREFPVVGEPKPFTESEIQAAFRQQAIDATLGHAQGAQPPTSDQLDQIVAFETSIFTAQARDNEAGSLHDDGATGGPVALSQQNFFLGVNDPLGGNPTGAPFNSVIFTLFDNWQTKPDRDDYGFARARAAIARGEAIFNNRPITITGVGGLNDVPLQDGQIHPSIAGFCGTCHSTPNAGNHSLPAPLNIGIADASRRTPDLPLFTILCNSGTVVQTTDPGRALISGHCADIGKFKGPTLRGLAARAPYFHNGMAADLEEVVSFYQTRFNLGLTDQEQRDLVAFLKSL